MIAGLSLPTTPVVAPAVPAAAHATTGTSDFAQALSAADRPAASTSHDPATPAPEHPARGHSPALPRPAARPQAGSPAPTRACARSEAEAPVFVSTLEPRGDEDPRAGPINGDAPPSLQALLGNLPPPPDPTPSLGGGARASAPSTTETAPVEPAPGRGPQRGLIRLAPETAATRGSEPATAPGDAVAAAPLGNTSPTAERLVSLVPAAPAAEPGPSTLVAGGTILPPAIGAATAPAAASAGAPPAAQAQLSAELHSAAFAPELGARICTFARHGVEHAQLQLHPAEMGPVTVQILVEGASAQVRLWAEQAPTRQALEQAMPSLASQLRDGGLTLTGGGVFEQPRQASDQARRDTGAAAQEASPMLADAAPLAIAVPSRRRGVVDLIA